MSEKLNQNMITNLICILQQ